MRSRVLLLLAAAALTPCTGCGGSGTAAPRSASSKAPAPVEVAAVERAPITLRRTFSGTIEASSRIQIASRVTGHLERLAVDIGDTVERDQVIAWIDDADLEQAVRQAEADLAVARASQAEAESAADLAARVLERLQALGTDGVASKSELDAASATASARQASVAVAVARVQRAESALESARIQRDETKVRASWDESSPLTDDGAAAPVAAVAETRAVAERFVDVGAIVAAGTPIVSIVGLRPILAVVYVPERDYARLAVGQVAQLATDAYQHETFAGRVARVAPVFSRATRQVRVEIELENADLRLKPGMFVRATLELDRRDMATVVPFAALTEREGAFGVFALSPGPAASPIVRWVPIVAGIREDALVEIVEPDLAGRVVTLGHELCEDGAPVVIPDDAPTTASTRPSSDR